MKVLLFGADGKTPLSIETSDQERLAALVVRAFGLLTGALPQSRENMQGWLNVAVETIGAEELTKAYPGLEIKTAPGTH